MSVPIHPEPLERSAECDKHGAYVSRCFIGNIWLKCPTCTAEREAEDRANEEAAKREAKQLAWQAKIGHAGIPERFRDRTLDSYVATTPGQISALRFAKEFASYFDHALKTGRSALFLGKPGTGKTHLAVGIALDAMKSGHSALFISVIRAIRRVKDTWSKGSAETETGAIAALTSPDLLILDEVGIQFGSEAEKMILFDVLNERYERRQPTLLLSNLMVAEVKTYLGDRIFDRMREDGGQVIVFDWTSYRIKEGK